MKVFPAHGPLVVLLVLLLMLTADDFIFPSGTVIVSIIVFYGLIRVFQWLWKQ
jgi:hypothetical protein